MTLLERLRASLAAPAPAGLLTGDLIEGDPAPAKAAAVLVAITRRPNPGLILTLRREHLRQHAGQIALPGGRVDPGDASEAAAALREAQEEIDLAPDAVTLWGAADPYRTVTGYRVIPILGTVAPDLPLTPHQHEVAEVFEAPLAFLLDPANQRAVTAEFQGRMRTCHEIEWEGRRVWGATAAMLVNLSRRIGWT
ncbi:CoA pyrophosphatase [Sphingomonas sp. GCM10030256]|uniref:CoA pyrophosphatase n=1 Tax=Sphingomonas sp. GCM10030256 TaxID=3273427 RepID=UPI0036088F56